MNYQLFINGLYKLLVNLEVVTLKENSMAVLVFAVGCAIIGFIAVILDLMFYELKGKSLLNFKHSLRNTFWFLLSWAVGSFIMGYIGQLFKIFQASLSACVIVGFTWPILFTQLIEKLKEQELAQQPVQPPGTEK